MRGPSESPILDHELTHPRWLEQQFPAFLTLLVNHLRHHNQHARGHRRRCASPNHPPAGHLHPQLHCLIVLHPQPSCASDEARCFRRHLLARVRPGQVPTARRRPSLRVRGGLARGSLPPPAVLARVRAPRGVRAAGPLQLHERWLARPRLRQALRQRSLPLHHAGAARACRLVCPHDKHLPTPPSATVGGARCWRSILLFLREFCPRQADTASPAKGPALFARFSLL